MDLFSEIQKIKRTIYFLQRKITSSGGGAVDSVNGQTGVVSLAVDDLSDVVAPTPADNDVLTWDSGTSKWINQAGGGGGSSTFIGLSDVPSSYSGQTLKKVRVNAAETALEFTDANEIYNLTSPTTITVGNLPSGTNITGMSLAEILEAILTDGPGFDYTFDFIID